MAPDGARTMSFWGHLAELRTRLVRSVGWALLAMVGAWFLLPQLNALLQQPLRTAHPELALNIFGVTEAFFEVGGQYRRNV